MSVSKNDSRRYEWHLYLKGLTKEVTPKIWMKPAMVSHLKNAYSIEEDEAEQFVDEWLNAIYGNIPHKNIIFEDDPADLRKCSCGCI